MCRPLEEAQLPRIAGLVRAEADTPTHPGWELCCPQDRSSFPPLRTHALPGEQSLPYPAGMGPESETISGTPRSVCPRCGRKGAMGARKTSLRLRFHQVPSIRKAVTEAQGTNQAGLSGTGQPLPKPTARPGPDFSLPSPGQRDRRSLN
jgi:hypothetical protein